MEQQNTKANLLVYPDLIVILRSDGIGILARTRLPANRPPLYHWPSQVSAIIRQPVQLLHSSKANSGGED